MKILVFSDTHGDVTKMERAIRSHSDAEVIIHCGDGEMDVEYAKRNFPDRAFLNVTGAAALTLHLKSHLRARKFL